MLSVSFIPLILANWRTPLRVRLTAFFLSVILSTLAHAQSAPGNAWDRFHAAIVKADRAAAASLLAADVQIFESGFVERSRDEYLSHHFEEDTKFAIGVSRRVLKRGEQMAENMALIMEETETSGTYEGKPIKLIGTETAVLRQNGENWQIVHIHWSSRKPKQ
jgi:ketosteroid isomerase-like protein